MKLLLVALTLVAAVSADPREFSPLDYTAFDYHSRFGIPEAARILAIEESLDFDGSRIAGGSQSSVGQHPHVGGMLIDTPRGTSVCGCSLISNTRIVTAAHCWFDGNIQARLLTVVLGHNRLGVGGTRITTNNVKMHPTWNHLNIRDDVAVAVISRVNYSNNIRSIGLASGNNDFAGTIATVAGYGRKGDGVGISSNQPLSSVDVQVITNAVCRQSFNIIVDSHICTSGAGGRSPCPGDSGGPLYTPGTLMGIVSFGSGWGCTRGFPAGFARISYYERWIRSQM